MTLLNLLEKFNINKKIDPETENYIFNHTMIRVKDLKKSITFYAEVLGFIPVYEEIFDDAKFTIVYLVRRNIKDIPTDDDMRKEWVLKQRGVLELTYNHGTEMQSDFSYTNGNGEFKGFGHICISVPDIASECKRFEKLGVEFQKKLSDGRMKHIAFIKDPDNYWIEIVQPTPLL